MFLRRNNRKKEGKDHRNFSIVENHRLASDRTVQRTVLYLGEINDEQQAAWRKTLSVFDERGASVCELEFVSRKRFVGCGAISGRITWARRLVASIGWIRF
jgi:hypothetical protein